MIATLARMLCTIGVHHVPEENRRWTSVGWFGVCQRCGARCSGVLL